MARVGRRRQREADHAKGNGCCCATRDETRSSSKAHGPPPVVDGPVTVPTGRQPIHSRAHPEAPRTGEVFNAQENAPAAKAGALFNRRVGYTVGRVLEPSVSWPKPFRSEVLARRGLCTDPVIARWTVLFHKHLLFGAATGVQPTSAVKAAGCGPAVVDEDAFAPLSPVTRIGDDVPPAASLPLPRPPR